MFVSLINHAIRKGFEGFAEVGELLNRGNEVAKGIFETLQGLDLFKFFLEYEISSQLLVLEVAMAFALQLVQELLNDE